MAKRDYYDVLGVNKDADNAAVKNAYRRLAMKYHPDRNSGDAGAEKKFKEVQEAYSCLSDEQKRAAYDRFGHSAFESGGGGGGGDPGFSSFFDEVFSDFFNGGRGPGGGRQNARQQRVLDINLSFDEMASGCEKEIRLTLPAKCDNCDGSGAEQGSSVKTCPTCDGHGQVRVQRSMFTLQQTCPKCRGEGRIIENPCGVCRGSGSVNKARNLQVAIPAGIEDGALVRVSLNQESRDELYIRPNIAEHPLFKRDGDNLHVEIPISMGTAALGGEVIIPSVKGGKLKMTVPAGTQNGKVLRAPSCGLPNVHNRRRGHLLCHIFIEVPINLTGEQEELLRKFEKSLKKKSHSPKEKSWLEKAKHFFTEQ